jgi:hypothetical protein
MMELGFQVEGAARPDDPRWDPVELGPLWWDWPTILVKYRFFPSRTQARRAGWIGTPVGFWTGPIGKKRRVLTVSAWAPWLRYWQVQTGLFRVTVPERPPA